MLRFRVQRTDIDQDWSKPLDITQLKRRLRALNKNIGPGPYHIIDLNTDKKGPELTSEEVFKKILHKIQAGEIGDSWAVRTDVGRYVVRNVEVTPDVTNTSGNDHIDRVYTEIFTQWKNAQNWGICVCKRIAGTYSWSQHSYCNAIDVHDTQGNMQEIADYLVENHERLNIHTVIFNRRIWTESAGWHYYSGVNPHTDHVHIDCTPWGTGWPSAC